MHALGYVPPCILLFPRRDQRIGIWALDTHESSDKIRLIDQPKQFDVVGEIEGRLGANSNG